MFILVYLLKNEFGICTSCHKTSFIAAFPAFPAPFAATAATFLRVLAYNLSGMCDDMFGIE
jgi:hypothetical protein